MLDVKALLTKILSSIKSMDSSLNNIGTQVLIGDSYSGGNFTLNESIDNFLFVLVEIYDHSYLAWHGCNFCSVPAFKTFTTTAHAFGVSGYNNGRIYAYVNYINATKLNAQVPSGYGVSVYGIMRK